MKWFKRRHKHDWRTGWSTMSVTPGFDDKTDFQVCRGCKETRTVFKHTCSSCGHVDEKHSLVLKKVK